MSKINSYTFITLNGFYKGDHEDISWHRHGEEEGEHAKEGLAGNGILLFGRKTYEMMSSYWPTPGAMQSAPEVAKGMNNAEKIVFSRTVKEASWNNTRVISDNIVEEMKRLKHTGSKDMTVLGSGSILTLFAQNNLIDEYQFMIDPVILGEGATILKSITKNLILKLTRSKVYKSGVILACYEPIQNNK
jgi:dihydrofolate reductase